MNVSRFRGLILLAVVVLLCVGYSGFTHSVMAAGSGNQFPRSTEADRIQQKELRRKIFDSGRKLLLEKDVPFNPNDLLDDDWHKKLKPTFDNMPEMQQARYEKAPLRGAYLADTLYLPEQVQLTGHTLILANYVVFEGKNPVIKGNFDLHFFPTQPVSVLGTMLDAALRKKAQFLNAKFGRKVVLPSFALIKDMAEPGIHSITFDVSGRPPQDGWRVLTPQPIPSHLRMASLTVLPAQDTPNRTCNSSCDNTPNPGTTGFSGTNQGKSATGTPDGGPPAPNGSCAGGQSANGFSGHSGGPGNLGVRAGDGGSGGVGFNAGNIDVFIRDGDTNQYSFIANGGTGGRGGDGGKGGDGGDGGAGQVGGNGVACGCVAGRGGDGGQGGSAGFGGPGGNGGLGGNGGNAGSITGSYPFNGTPPTTSAFGGLPGQGGAGGPGGNPGTPGAGGQPGSPATACGQTASAGNFLGSGPSSSAGGPGNPGANGQSRGLPGNIAVQPRPDPNGGGGGGGIGPTDPCLGGSGGRFTPDGGPAPDCSPIIVDTEGEGFHLTSTAGGVSFDISGTGHPVQMGWTDSRFHNGFLALPGADGLVHNGKQLFGNFTPQPKSANPNGFIALAQYDKSENGGNGDGVIDGKDAVYSRLRLWIDENHDGISQPNELRTLSESGIHSISLDYSESRKKDEFGNVFRFRSKVNAKGPGDFRDERQHGAGNEVGRWAYDVFFVTK